MITAKQRVHLDIKMDWPSSIDDENDDEQNDQVTTRHDEHADDSKGHCYHLKQQMQQRQLRQLIMRHTRQVQQ